MSKHVNINFKQLKTTTKLKNIYAGLFSLVFGARNRESALVWLKQVFSFLTLLWMKKRGNTNEVSYKKMPLCKEFNGKL